MTKRNALCGCGSGKKFKHCHGRHEFQPSRDAHVERRLEAIIRDRQAQQGLGKPIQFYQVRDGIAVVVGRSIMIGPWKSFTDFLLHYLAERMGRRWITGEMSRGSDGHPIGQWASAMKGTGTVSPGTVTAQKINNAFRSLTSAAYNVYLIEHHYEQYDQPLFERIIGRLRRTEDFFATLAETNAAASFLKAGFFLEYEDDLRGGHHAEFIATYPQTHRKFSVEVKTRSGILHPELALTNQLKLKNKLSRALKKDLPWSRVVFIDLNIPDVIEDERDPILAGVLAEIEDAERSLKIKGAAAPAAYFFLTNQPFHYNLDSFDGAPLIGALGFRLPTFQPRGPVSFRDIVRGREAHHEMHALIVSMKAHSEPPSTFDGQPPEFVYGKTDFPRWLIGSDYLVPGPNGIDVVAALQSACAMPDEARMHGVFAFEGSHFVVDSPMTEAEVAVYRRHPETFFGVVQSVGGKAKDAAELADFFYQTYKDTPKEKLLEFLKDHPLLDRVREFSQRDLAIFICEQWALGAAQNKS